MVKKYALTLILSMFFLGVTSVNAQKKASISPDTRLSNLDYFTQTGLIKEGRWLSISKPSMSYKMRFYDLYEQYQDSFIGENVHSDNSPVQFIKVGDRYLPHIILSYKNVSFSIISAKEIPNYAQYVQMLEQRQRSRIYLDVHTKKELPFDDIKSVSQFIELRKNIQDEIDITKLDYILYIAKVYDYYSDGTLKTETTYSCDRNTETNEECVIWSFSTDTYEQGAGHKLLNYKDIQLNGPEDIEHDVLRPLFMQNKVILEKLKKQK